MFAVTTEGGSCFGFPDVCKTPSPSGMTPVPYPNLAQPRAAQSGSFSQKVFIHGQNACSLKTKISTSAGDEPGSGGGIVSSTGMNKGCFLSGSTAVFIQGPPAARLMSSTGQNGDNPNTTGSVIAPGQTVVMIMR